MKTIKIENSYNLGDSFSNVSLEGAWIKLVNYIKGNKDLYENVNFLKDSNEIIIKSNNENTLNFIKKVDIENQIKKSLYKTIKLNLKFNKETKELEVNELLNNELNDLNTVSYKIGYEFNTLVSIIVLF